MDAKEIEINKQMIERACRETYDGTFEVGVAEFESFTMNVSDVDLTDDVLADVSQEELNKNLSYLAQEKEAKIAFKNDPRNRKKLAFIITRAPICFVSFFRALSEEDQRDLEYYLNNRDEVGIPDGFDNISFGSGMIIHDRMNKEKTAWYDEIERDDFYDLD